MKIGKLKQSFKKISLIIGLVWLVSIGSVASFSMLKFGMGSNRALSVENLMLIKPVLETLGLLIFAKLSQSLSNKEKLNYWFQVIFYSLFLSLLSFGLVFTKFSIWHLIQGMFPVNLMSNTFACALVGIMATTPLISKFEDSKYLKYFSLIGIIVLSVVPTIIWSTHLVSPVQNVFGGLFWGMLIAVIVKATDGIKVSNKFLSAYLVVFAVIVELLLWIGNSFNTSSKVFWTGFFMIKHLMFLNTNFLALILSLGIYLFIRQHVNYISSVMNYFIAAVIVNTHFIFSKPLWNQIFHSADWLNNSGLVMILNMIGAALLVSLLIIGFEKITQSAFEQLISYKSKWQIGVLSALIVTVISYLVLIITDSTMDAGNLLFMAGNKPLLMLLNIGLLFIFILMIYVLINHWITASVVSFVLMIALAFGNYQKLISRNEPLTPIDISSNLKNASEILDLVNIWLIVGLLISFVILITISIFVERKLKITKVFNWISRIFIFLVGGLSLALFIFKLPLVPSSSVTWKPKDKNTFNETLVKQMGYRYHPEGAWNDFRKNGQVLAFMSRIRIPIMDKPSGYSKESIDRLASKYSQNAVEINKTRKNKVNNDVIIYILSESFSNPNRVPGVKTDSDPIPYINSLKNNNTSGIMDSYGYGGGTADMEFEALSGMSLNNFAPALSTPYVELMPKLNYMPTVLDLFKTKTAIHPYQPTLYNRINVFKQFGFQKFYNTDSPYKISYTDKLKGSKYISDASAYKEVGKVLKKNKGGQFIQLSTMQNHMPFLPNEYKNNYGIKANALNKHSRESLSTYTEGIHQSDSAMKELIKSVDNDKRNISIVFYGDHLPGLYNWTNGNDDKINQYDSLLHQTDYFIYSNHASRKVKKEIAAPYMFTPMMLDQTNSKLSGYYAFLTKCMQELPAGERGKYMLADGKQIKENDLNSSQKKLLHEYQLLQYDITAGHHYLKQNSKFFDTED